MKNIFKKIIGVVTAAVLALSASAFSACADDAKKIPQTEGIKFVDKLGMGWNLGNAFDAIDDQWVGTEMDYEGAWQPDRSIRTTKALIKTVKNAGFTTFRLPVSWHNHVDSKFNISEQWLARVKEVVDWCMDEGLYVVLNIHHDVKKGFYYPSTAEYAASKKYMTGIWQQLCETFKDYDEHLIFEAINEPRPTEASNPWWYDANNVPDEYKDALMCINKLNQVFVDTVRASGGNNKNRYLLVGGFATSESNLGILSPYFEMPTDTAEDKLIADVHYYCSNLNFQKSTFDKLYSAFVSKGIPVYMTEFGLKKDYEEGYWLHDRTEESAKKLGEIAAYARECGISSIFWDNNNGGKGKIGFKIIDRATAKVELPTIVSAIVEAGAPAFDTAIKVSTTATKSTIKLTWSKVSGATKYAVYQYTGGKYKAISKKLTKTTATLKNLKSGTTYKFIVRAYVNGKWTAITNDSIIKVKTK